MVEPSLFRDIEIFRLGFEMVFITKEFTIFQMRCHYILVLTTLIFMFLPKIGFFYEMLRLHQNFWSRQQVCTICLSDCLTPRHGRREERLEMSAIVK